MTRLHVAWVAIVAFLPLYAAAGTVLRARVAPIDRPDWLYAALGAWFAVLALVLRPALKRAGVHDDAAHMVAWASAEAVAIVGLVAWVETGEMSAYAAGAVLSFALMLALFPRLPKPG